MNYFRIFSNSIVFQGRWLLFIFIYGCLFISCKKEPEYYPLSSEFEKYYLFQQGSFWVYKNDSTGVLDSVYLNLPPQYFDIIYEESGPKYERVFLDVSSLNFSAYRADAAFYEGHDVLQMRFPTHPDYDLPVLISGGMAVEHYDHHNGYYRYIESYREMTLNGKDYSDVIQTQAFFLNDNYSVDEYRFYFAKNVGLIKLSGHWNDSTQSWSLIRYNIVH
jgi:hypothetical protein